MVKRVLVGGTFNILHPGHILFLKKAKSLGNYLIVVVASDSTVKREKGALVLPAEKRAGLLRNLKFIDKVLIGSEENKLKVVEREKPDIIALGYDQKGEDELRKKLKERGLTCKVWRIREHLEGWNTSKIIKKRENRL